MSGRRRRLARMWGSRVGSWHQHVTTGDGFELIRDQVLQHAHIRDNDVVVDLGAGTGFLTFAAAPLAASVIAVDVAAPMVTQLQRLAAADGHLNVTARLADLAGFDLPAGSVDVVVSNYALHHLSHADKRALLGRVRRWLRPGGRVVVADMMFGRGGSSHDRRVLREKVIALAGKGPGGLWRIMKNLVRFGLGVGSERPAPPEFWLRAFRDAGLRGATYEPVVAEAGLVYAVVPLHPVPRRSARPGFRNGSRTGAGTRARSTSSQQRP